MRSFLTRLCDLVFGPLLREEIYGSEDRIQALLQQHQHVVLPDLFAQLEDAIVERMVAELNRRSIRSISGGKRGKTQQETTPITEVLPDEG